MSESSHGVVDATFPLIGGCKPGLDSMVLPSTSQKANQCSQKPFPRPQAYNLPSSGSPRVQGLCRVLSHWSAPAAGELPVQALPHLCRLCPTSAGSAPWGILAQLLQRSSAAPPGGLAGLSPAPALSLHGLVLLHVNTYIFRSAVFIFEQRGGEAPHQPTLFISAANTCFWAF